MMKKRNIVSLVLFCGILAVFTALSIFGEEQEFSEKENRILQTKPEIYPEALLDGSFQEEYEAYLNDQFTHRDSWVDLSVKMSRAAGKKDINGVYIGKDGYLLEKYTDEDFNSETVEENIYYLSDFLNVMTEEYGAEHVNCLMVPAKANVLENKLPVHAVGYPEERIISEIRGSLEEPGILLDLTDTLKEHQDEYIYYRTDHHWTTLGAYYAYAAWAERTGHKAKLPEAYTIETAASDFYGTTYNKVYLKVPADNVQLFRSRGQRVSVDQNDGEKVSDSFYFPDDIEDESDKYRVFLGGNTAKIEIETNADTDKRLLLIKDSFANCFVPFLAEDYGKITMIDFRYYSDTLDVLMEECGDFTDLLVMYNVEKFMQDSGIDMMDTLLL